MGNDPPRVAPGQSAPVALRGPNDQQPPARRQQEQDDRIPIVSDVSDFFRSVGRNIFGSAPTQPVEPTRPPANVGGVRPVRNTAFGSMVNSVTGDQLPATTQGTGIRVTNDPAAVPDPRVQAVQDNLRYLGFFQGRNGAPAQTPRPGVFDTVTHAAMVQFQGNYSGTDGREVSFMDHNGELKQESMTALAARARQQESAIGQRQIFEQLGHPTLRAGDNAPENAPYRQLAKQALSLLGYDVDPKTDTFDQKTRDAVRSFQSMYGQQNDENLGDDSIGPATGRALNRALQQAELLGRTEPWRSNVQREIDNNPLGQRVLRPDEVDRRGRPVPVQRTAAETEVINQTQRRLGELGYTMTNGADIKTTKPMEPGRFTPEMSAAIADFQRVYSLMPGNSPILPNGRLDRRTVAALNSPAADAAIARLDELRPGLRNAFVVDGYNRGQRSPMVVRSMGQSPDGDRPTRVNEQGETVPNMRDRYLETRPALAFVALQAQAKRDGVDLLAGSGFRPKAEQTALFRSNGSRRSKAAPPGFSNHQGGRALDFVLAGERGQAWLRRNGGDAGFHMMRGGNEDHHGDYVVGDVTPHVRQQLGFNAGGMEAEPERVVQRSGRGRSTRSSSRNVSRSHRHRR